MRIANPVTGFFWSLERKLPLLIVALLCAMVGAFGVFAHKELENAFEAAAAARLVAAAHRMSALVVESADSVRREGDAFVRDDAIANLLTANPNATPRDDILSVLQPRAVRAASRAVWTRGCHRIAASGSLANSPALVACPPPETTFDLLTFGMSSKSYSAAEDLANSLTHGVGLALSLIGAPVLIVSAVNTNDAWRIVAACIYAATLIVLYTASTLYHSVRSAENKEIWQRVDHAAIYLLIAGTYTPFTLISLRGAWGWSLFGVVWGLALVGVLMKSRFGARLPALSTWIYLGMGWVIVIAMRPLATHVAPAGIFWLALGGALYTGGVVFYVWEKVRYSHAVWHLFVLGGSVAHFTAVLWYALPA